MHLLKLLTFLLVFSAASSLALGQDMRRETVRFPRGASGTTIEDSIRGREAVQYIIGVDAGQRMSIRLDSSNSSNYFNVTAPGANAALFVGSASGNRASFVVPSSGNYVIDVYLMRNAARRNERADYSLSIQVDGRSAQAPPPSRPAPRPDYADGLAGGPDFWEVVGLSRGDTLNLRAGPSTSHRVLSTAQNGDTLRNLGCTVAGGTRWCQVEGRRGNRGWVAGRYLAEASGRPAPSQPPRPPVAPPQNPAPDTVSTGMMPRYCAGEAAARFDVSPRALTTNQAMRSGRNYVVQGYFDAGGRTTFFNCYFGLDGSFQSVN